MSARFTITGVTSDTDYTYENSTLTIKTSTPITIKNTNTGATTDKIFVAKNVSANITLAGVNIDCSTSGGCAFKIDDNTTSGEVTVILADGTTNKLKSSDNNAGLQKCGKGGTLEITGSGELTAAGGEHTAGIGGNNGGSATGITISGGTVTAIGSEGAAGIGGGYCGTASGVKITGGSVKAVAGKPYTPYDGSDAYNAPDIGSGVQYDGRSYSDGTPLTPKISTSSGDKYCLSV